LCSGKEGKPSRELTITLEIHYVLAKTYIGNPEEVYTAKSRKKLKAGKKKERRRECKSAGVPAQYFV